MAGPAPGADQERAAKLKSRLAQLEATLETARAIERIGAREEARRRAAGVDAVLSGVLGEVLQEAGQDSQMLLPGAERRRRARASHPDFAVVGVGGYGRAELSPRSDVDLVFVVKGKESARAFAEKAVIEKVLYALWDSGLEVGHAVRTIAECVAVGKKEVTARSSMLDHRWVAGDRDLYAAFASQLERRLFRIDAAGFVGAKLLEIAKRRERWGHAVSRNEPNLKEGEGGLRDAHTALWIARAVWGIGDSAGLVSRGLARPGDVAEFEAAFERLLEVRAALHRLAGRKEDRLSFDRQEATALALGFQESKRASATEHFMQALTQAMAAVQRFLQLVVDRMPDRFHERAEKMGATGLGHTTPKGRIRPPKGFRVRRGRLLFGEAEGEAGSPIDERAERARSGWRGSAERDRAIDLMRIFAASARYDLPLHPEARDRVRRERDRIREVREQTAAVEAFFELLLHSDGEAVERAMLEMNDLGALGAFLPEFDALFYRVQHDTYHVYTSDAHLIIAGANAHRLRAGEWEESEPTLTAIARELPPRVFVLGTFLHDIGKSERGHTEAGLRMLPSICRQLRLPDAEAETIRFLMAEHLLMSHVAQRRDLSDPKTISDFAAKIGTRERLELLYAMTFCDIMAVGPGAWTDWKGALLRELYTRARAALTGGPAAVADELSRRAAATRAGALAAAKGRLDNERIARLQEFLERLPERYFADSDPESVLDDFLLARTEAKGGLKVQARVLPSRATTEVTFQAPDRAGLFADFTGALAAAGLSIRTARIHTTTDRTAIDRFEVAGPTGEPVDLLALDRMVRDLLWVMTGKQTAAELLARRKPPSYGPARRRHAKPKVEISNDASEAATVVDVYAPDRLGLLHDIASLLRSKGIDIQVAIVSTKVDQVADSFYVRTIDGGGKLTDPKAIEELKADLLAKLEG